MQTSAFYSSVYRDFVRIFKWLPGIHLEKVDIEVNIQIGVKLLNTALVFLILNKALVFLILNHLGLSNVKIAVLVK